MCPPRHRHARKRPGAAEAGAGARGQGSDMERGRAVKKELRTSTLEVAAIARRCDAFNATPATQTHCITLQAAANAQLAQLDAWVCATACCEARRLAEPQRAARTLSHAAMSPCATSGAFRPVWHARQQATSCATCTASGPPPNSSPPSSTCRPQHTEPLRTRLPWPLPPSPEQPACFHRQRVMCSHCKCVFPTLFAHCLRSWRMRT